MEAANGDMITVHVGGRELPLTQAQQYVLRYVAANGGASVFHVEAAFDWWTKGIVERAADALLGLGLVRRLTTDGTLMPTPLGSMAAHELNRRDEIEP